MGTETTTSIGKRIKRIIAREGLIIISLLLLSGASFLIGSYIDEQKYIYEESVIELAPFNSMIEQHNSQSKRFIDPYEPRFKMSVKAWTPDESELEGILGPWVDISDNAEIVNDKRAVFDVIKAKEKGYSNFEIADCLGEIVRFPKETQDDVIEMVLKRDLLLSQGTWGILNSPVGKNISASYNEKGERIFDSLLYKLDYTDVLVFFLLIAYPLYLLGRFIVWSVMTLREKS